MGWKSDYGDPEKKEDFEVLLKYSPYHNLKPGPKYPAVLATSLQRQGGALGTQDARQSRALREITSPLGRRCPRGSDGHAPLPQVHHRLGWKSDYGDPEKKEDFEVLLKYSPYHNLKPGPKYPAVLATSLQR